MYLLIGAIKFFPSLYFVLSDWTTRINPAKMTKFERKDCPFRMYLPDNAKSFDDFVEIVQKKVFKQSGY